MRLRDYPLPPKLVPQTPTTLADAPESPGITDVDGAIPPFRAFPKIARLSKDIIITEKIDGTNAQVHVLEDGRVLAASRNRYLTVDKDNFGFAAWVAKNEDELRTGLGVGRHYGEWYGRGIQRGYGLKDRYFALFNVSRWVQAGDYGDIEPSQQYAPPCCQVVPTLYRGPLNDDALSTVIGELAYMGSQAIPGYRRPEGIVIYCTGNDALFKWTFEGDTKTVSGSTV